MKNSTNGTEDFTDEYWSTQASITIEWTTDGGRHESGEQKEVDTGE